MLLCSHCQFILADNSQFCNRCGAPTAPTNQHPPQYDPQYAPPPMQAEAVPAQKKSMPFSLVAMLSIFAMCGLCGFCAKIGNLTTPQSDKAAATWTPAPLNAQAQNQANNSAMPYLVVEKSGWEKGGFGSIAMWKVTFRNTSDKPIGNISYETTYYSETGNVVDRGGVSSVVDKKVIQKVIAPKSKRTIEVNDGFTHSEAHTAIFLLTKCEFVNDQR